ncbi:hypothetical protein [Prevotella sp. P6B1]|uniref:hypothetical protein n=1 Tax=Prevotella sp. P6B1 TaxID=1410613 RepID=UPI00051ACBAD|nr:hypothetical protein [Prevotella sp. P6B1]
MELFDGFFSIIMAVWAILNIILFFKIWGMTNDVKELKDYIIGNNFVKSTSSEIGISSEIQSEEETELPKSDPNSLKIGDRVRHNKYNKDKIMIIGKINNDGSCLCLDEQGHPLATYSLENLIKE